MMKWLRKHRYKIFLVTVVGFLLGSFMGFGSYFFQLSPYDAAVEVNGEEIAYRRYLTRYRQYLTQRRDQAGPMNEDRIKQVKQEALQDLVRETVFLQEADKLGISVTDNELASYIQQAPAFQKDGRFDQNTYLQVVTQILRMPTDEFEEDRRRELKVRKMQSLMASSIKITDQEFAWHLEQRMAAAKPEDRKAMAQKPNEIREQIRQEQVNYVFQEWLAQVNSQLQVKVFLEKWEGRGET